MKLDLIERKDNFKKHGIYIITNNINDKVYIGSALCLYTRCCEHKGMLKNKNHKNPKLTNFVKKYYDDVVFNFSVLEYVKNKKDLVDREQFYLNKYLKADKYLSNEDKKSFHKLGFNNRAKAESNIGIKLNQSEEFREFQRQRFIKMNKDSESRKEVYKRIAESNRGRKLSKKEIERLKTQNKGEKNPNSKLSDKDVLFLRYLNENYEVSQKLMSCIYNVTKEQVWVLKAKKQRKNIEYELTDEDIIELAEKMLVYLETNKQKIFIELMIPKPNSKNTKPLMVKKYYTLVKNLMDTVNLNK